MNEFKEIKLDNYIPSGESYNAITYVNKNNDNEMLKLYASRIEKQTVIDEFVLAKQVYDLKVKSPKPYELVKFNDQYGITFERIKHKVSFARAIGNNPDRAEELAKIFAIETRKIHNIVIKDTSNVTDWEKYLRELVSKTNVVDDEVKTLLFKLLDKTEKTTTFLHGDLHLGNILLANDEIYWIDMGGFAYGNPLFDLGKLAFSSYIMTDQPIIYEILHIDYETSKKIWPTFIKEYFKCGDDKISYYTDIILCYTLYFEIYMCDVFHRSILPPEKKEFLINQIKKVLPTL